LPLMVVVVVNFGYYLYLCSKDPIQNDSSIMYIFRHSRRNGTSSIKQSEHGKSTTYDESNGAVQAENDVAEKGTKMMAEMTPI
jgi:hypothetical protein